MPEDSAIRKFYRENVRSGIAGTFSGKAGMVFGPAAIAGIVTAENKFKAVLALLRDIVMMRVGIASIGPALYGGMTKAIRAIISDTGSLQAAINKLKTIQGLEKTFAPLLGGIEAAKQKVAELVTMSGRNGIRLESLAEGYRQLELMTRGAYSGAQALDTLSSVSRTTGASIVDLSGAVGVVSGQLRENQSIEGSLESLRMLGAISQITSDRLIQMQQTGQSGAAIFQELTSSFNKLASGANTSKQSIEDAEIAYSAALDTLKEKFGSPFVESDVKNVQNMTAAMQAIAPNAERLSRFLANLTGGFSTARSGVIKMAGDSKILRDSLEILIKTITGLVAVVGVLGGIAAGAFLLQFASGAAAAATQFLGMSKATGLLLTSLKALSAVITGGLMTGGIVAIGTALAVAAGITYNFVKAANAHKRAMEDLVKANQEVLNTVRSQVDAISDLTSKHETLASILSMSADAYGKWAEAVKRGAPEIEKKILLRQAQALDTEAEIAANTKASGDIEIARQKVSRSKAEQKDKFEADMAKAGLEKRIKLQQQEAKRLEELVKEGAPELSRTSEAKARMMDITSQITAAERSPVSAIERQISTLIKRRIPLAEQLRGQQEAMTSNVRMIIEDELKEIDTLIQELRVGMPKQRPESVDVLRARRQAAGLGGSPTTRAETLLEQIGFARQVGAPRMLKGEFAGMSKEELDAAQQEQMLLLEKARQTSDEVIANQTQITQLKEAAAADQRELDLVNEKLTIEEKVAKTKAEGFALAQLESQARIATLNKELDAEKKKGDMASESTMRDIRKQIILEERNRRIGEEERSRAEKTFRLEFAKQKAELSGNTAATRRIEDEEKVRSKFEELRPMFSPENAAKMAAAFTKNAIAIQGRTEAANLAGMAAISSLARIGGGGGVEAVRAGTDSSAEILKRQEAIEKTSMGILQQILDKMGTGSTLTLKE